MQCEDTLVTDIILTMHRSRTELLNWMNKEITITCYYKYILLKSLPITSALNIEK